MALPREVTSATLPFGINWTQYHLAQSQGEVTCRMTIKIGCGEGGWVGLGAIIIMTQPRVQ